MNKKSLVVALSAALTLGSMNLPINVLASPVTILEEEQGYKDVGKDYWAFEEITDLIEQGIITSPSSTNFYPNQEVTREDAAIWLANALNLELFINLQDPNYTDIPKNHPHYRHIAAVSNAGIFDGRDGYFNPSDSLTRAQMAKVLVESFDLTGEYPKGFRDIRESFWAKNYIHQLASSGVTTGYNEDNTFRPNNTTTRAQLAAFIFRALEQKRSNLIDEAPDYVRNLSDNEIRERFGHYTADDFQHVFGNVEIVKAQFVNNEYYEIVRTYRVNWERYVERIQNPSRNIMFTPIEEIELAKNYYRGSIMNNQNYPYSIYLTFEGKPIMNHPYYEEFGDQLRTGSFWAAPNYDPINNETHASFEEVLSTPKESNQLLINFHQGFPYQFSYQKDKVDIIQSEPLVVQDGVYVDLNGLLSIFKNADIEGLNTIESNGQTMVNLTEFAELNHLHVREMLPLGQYQLANYPLGQSF